MEEHGRPFDVCIVCALYEEAEAVLNEFSTRCGVAFVSEFSRVNQREYRYTVIQNKRGEPLTVLVTWLADMGSLRTALDLTPLLHEVRPRFAAMTGICAGNRGKVKLGDLIVANYTYHLEEGKITRGADDQAIHLPETRTVGSTTQVIQYAKGFKSWEEPLRELKRQKLKRPLKAVDEPKCYVEVMASSMVVRADNPFPQVTRRHNRKTIGIDMEAAAFYLVLRDFPLIHPLVVKGVSDYADGSKNDRYHDYAARASAIYLLHFIREYVTEQTMPRRDAPPFSDRPVLPGVWNVPHARNPHFTGRDELLDRLHQQLAPASQDDAMTMRRAALTQPQAIKGLGGIGKKIAVEYAYRSRDQGRYIHTFWINAASEETLISSFVALAKLLPSFPEKSEVDQQKLVEAIKRWLEQCEQRWLLIFDNADDLPIVREYLPQRGNGGVLLTTRANAVGSLAASIEVEKMGLMEGTQFLLHRAQRLDHAADEEINEAGNIVIALDHFPLALDQAGAYIEETACSFVDYLKNYQIHRKELLARRGLQATNYPDSVATTWSLSFHKVEQANSAAAQLLCLFAYLCPDNIPEELIRDGAAHWNPPLQQAATDPFTFDQMIADLLKFSLVERLTETHMLSVHRLVQAVQMDTMEPAVQRQWAERVVRAVNSVFPAQIDIFTWLLCGRHLSQAQACADLVKQYELAFAEASQLLSRTARYLQDHALYEQAESLYQGALFICKRQSGEEHPDTASCLHNLALLYRDQKQYTEAEALVKGALAIYTSYRQQPGEEHPDTANCLNTLANLYRDQGRDTEAEPLYLGAIAISEQQLGPEHPWTLSVRQNYASLQKILRQQAGASLPEADSTS